MCAAPNGGHEGREFTSVPLHALVGRSRYAAGKTTLHASNCSIKNSWLFFQVGFTLHVGHYDAILRTPDKLCNLSIYFTFSLI
jgi:hypothetical protein